MLLMEMKMTADPEQVAALKEANDTVTEWATVEFIINGTAVERRTFNLIDILGILTDGVVTGVITPDEGVKHFTKLTEQGETVLSHLDPLGSLDDSPTAKMLCTIGNLTDTGKNMTDAERNEAIMQMSINEAINRMFGGLDVIDTDGADTDTKEG